MCKNFRYLFAEIKNMSYTEAMLNLLAEEGGEQLQSLGTIKGVEAAMKFIMSGRIGMVPDAASFENCKTLKGMEIKPTSVDGKEITVNYIRGDNCNRED